ncbi:uncharacterized protein LY79DRAFT_244949 [Colletotrichum navitas]|uniref:Transmembrane protein n=1 Tax=Colletotrichum navitas TaxID=681940 RepID=A0AAD8PXQ4_9PEZI|nr:uncharacterized protein LY79DRAFT_244949 [Colletotrichum navitas]KAK1586036.1 hypothetical protein LY79DRAFT_244949 [Colletotrichum navitas]
MSLLGIVEAFPYSFFLSFFSSLLPFFFSFSSIVARRLGRSARSAPRLVVPVPAPGPPFPTSRALAKHFFFFYPHLPLSPLLSHVFVGLQVSGLEQPRVAKPADDLSFSHSLRFCLFRVVRVPFPPPLTLRLIVCQDFGAKAYIPPLDATSGPGGGNRSSLDGSLVMLV